MIGSETRLQLEQITDEGLFEKLTDALLRESEIPRLVPGSH